MYQYCLQVLDLVQFLGVLVDFGSISLLFEVGWNWIGYLLCQGMSVNDVFFLLMLLNGDVIKGQVIFVQYVVGVGWVGNFNFMVLGCGYLFNFFFLDELFYLFNLIGGVNIE